VCFLFIAFLTCVLIDSYVGIVFCDLGDTWVALGGGGVRCVAGQTTSGGIADRIACMLGRVDAARGAPLADGGLGSVVPCGSCVGVYIRLMPGSYE
jgi:hypothetical protein